MHRSLAIAAALLMLSSCSKDVPEKRAGVIPPYQQTALQDARNIQQQLNDAAARQRRDLEQQETQ